MAILHLSVLILLVTLCTSIPHSVSRKALTLGSPCKAEAECPERLSCDGEPGNKVCVRRARLFKRCNANPFNPCRPGLTCRSNVCMRTIPRGSPCPIPGSTCRTGTFCLGRRGKMSCRLRRRMGERCGHSAFAICRRMLFCDAGICRRMVGEGGNCNSANRVCEAGLSCVGEEGEKTCAMPSTGATLGMACDEDSPCTADLVCDDEVCKMEARAGESCAGPVVCESPLSCMGPSDAPQCHRMRGGGESCGETLYDICGDGLVCFEGICQSILSDDGEEYY